MTKLHAVRSVRASSCEQNLYLENNAIRALPPGRYWRHLKELSTDWECLLRSHHLLKEVRKQGLAVALQQA